MTPKSKSHKPDHYRQDIAGLRGAAVLAVLAYHVDAARIQGGFVGVDIFFVLSGYLIAGILARDLRKGTFSLSAFYERRIRRILPAMFAMLAAVSGLAIYLLLPQDLVNYTAALRAAVLSYSNFFFWHTGNYFSANYTWLLLHTWSLAVEEQFYIVFPVTLMVLWRYPRLLLPALWVVFGLSLGYASWLAYHDATAAFYNPVSRAWELLAGCLLALVRARPRLSRQTKQVVCWVGLGLVLFPVFFYSKLTVFPGASALLPCGGTVLLLGIGEGEPMIVSRLLSWKPLTWFGTISYSLYLWHWPVILASHFEVFPLLRSHGPGKIMLPLISVMLGYLSWRFIEQPFRVPSVPRKRWEPFSAAASGACGLLLLSGVIWKAHGFPGRFPPRALEIASWASKQQELDEYNMITMRHGLSSWSVTDHAVLDPKGNNYLLIGDSHAAALRPGFAAQPGVNLQMAVQANCEPLIDLPETSACGAMSRYLFQQFLPYHQVNLVLYTHRWLDRSEIDAMAPTVMWFKKKRIPVILIGPVPEYRAPLPMLLAYSVRLNEPGFAARNLDPKYADLDRYLQEKTTQWQIPYISAYRTYCPKLHCKEYMDSDQLIPTLYDGGHVTNVAAKWAVAQWIERGDLIWPAQREATLSPRWPAE